MEEFQKNIKSSLNNANEEEIKKIAGLPCQGIVATKKILEKILETPDISEQTEEFIGSQETSKDLKAFNSGYEKGRKAGVSEGFAKGVAATATVAATTTVAVTATAFFMLARYMFFKKES